MDINCRTSYPASGGIDVPLGPCVVLIVSHQDVPQHPDQLEQHEGGDKSQQVLFLHGGVVVRDGQHQRQSDQQQVGPVLTAEELRVLLRVVPGQAELQFTENLLLLLGAG